MVANKSKQAGRVEDELPRQTGGSVVVTGSEGGLGRAICRALADAGWAVATIDLVPASFGVGYAHTIGDVTQQLDVERAAHSAEEMAPLRAWINNAAVDVADNLHEYDADQSLMTLKVNLQGAAIGSAVAVQHALAAQSPLSIVNISSVQASNPLPGWASYVMAKGGVEALTRYTAVEYGAAGIRANAIAPGNVRTRMLERAVREDLDSAITELEGMNPMRVLATPEQIASIVAMMAGPQTSHISGVTLPVDAGAVILAAGLPTRFRSSRAYSASSGQTEDA